MPDPDRNPGGTWDPPPPRPRLLVLASLIFSLSALLALLLQHCDIGAILAAIAFVLGFSHVAMARSTTGDPDQPPGGTLEIPPPTAAFRPPPAPRAILVAAASAFNAATVIAVIVRRCDLALLAVVIAALLALLSLLARRGGSR